MRATRSWRAAGQRRVAAKWRTAIGSDETYDVGGEEQSGAGINVTGVASSWQAIISMAARKASWRRKYRREHQHGGSVAKSMTASRRKSAS